MCVYRLNSFIPALVFTCCASARHRKGLADSYGSRGRNSHSAMSARYCHGRDVDGRHRNFPKYLHTFLIVLSEKKVIQLRD